MKYFNTKELEKHQEQLKELFYEILPYLQENQAHYARIAGFSRQYVHELIKCDFESTTKHVDAKRLIHLYKVIYLDQSGVSR